MSSSMDTDELSVVLPSSTTSGLSLSLHPLPILNISDHLTRLRLQTNSTLPFVLGALLGTQNGREVEIVNTFELATQEGREDLVDHDFLISRRDQYKQVFPSLEFIGWYSVAHNPTSRHITLHDQFTRYCSTPLLLVLQPSSIASKSSDITGQTLPFKAYEPTIEIRDKKTRSVFIEAVYKVETGEAERIAVDWTAKGGGGGTSLESHLQTQRAAVKMLHERILVLVQYVTDVLAGQVPNDHTTLRSLSALVASLPASEDKGFREEFDTEYEDVQLTAFLSSLTKSANALNDLVDKHLVFTGGARDDRVMPGPRRRMGRHGTMPGDWSMYS
ncbi:maintenance of mitochondrial structure and function-domain-containing protein [Hygrophoropsis aurantiaca]|uniref:Maintenance of mitochondrial structure and function-domain-containing protein n=1 Tax=Hygrophoropsis aurantiaca TaxID=72124 RepID=A0ACB8AP12_9AGAM|nr:maintenance of mitochondrial structure and function-domain-containing protein [Hygrophoropsis aurantiaca]